MGTPKLFILSEQMRGTSFSLTLDRYTIGRADECDICISDPTISGQHCTLSKQEDGTFVIQDDGSTNGTKINSNQVEPGQAYPLKNGDILQIGGIEILFDDIHGERIESRTISVINLEDTGKANLNNTTLRNMGNKLANKHTSALRSNQSHDAIVKIVLGIIGVVALIVIVTLFLL